MHAGSSPTTSGLRVFTAEERPDLWVRAKALSEVWPEYNNHGNHTEPEAGTAIVDDQRACLGVGIMD